MRPDIEEFRPVSQRASESCPPRSTSSSYSEITPPPVNGEPLGTSKRQELYSIRASFNEQFFHDAARMSPVFQGTLNAYTSSLEAALSAETKKNEKLAQDLIETKTLYIAVRIIDPFTSNAALKAVCRRYQKSSVASRRSDKTRL